MLQISELYIYPIKSLPGIKLNRARVTPKGLEHDRRWMLVDEHNVFISQREFPQLTQFVVTLKENGLYVAHKRRGDSLPIPFSANGEKIAVTVWDDTCDAALVGDEADKWFSDMTGLKCRLVYMPDDSMRSVDERYAPEDKVTSFSDAYPFLLIGQASLDELNSRLKQALPIDRFRPNIVFTGGTPFEEDSLGHFKIDEIHFYGVKLCARCVVITIDQQNGKKEKEPLKTLSSYRQKNKKIYFGQNLIHTGEGNITVGDELEVISKNTDERFIVSKPEELNNVVDIDKTYY